MCNHFLRSIKSRFEEWTSEWLPFAKRMHQVKEVYTDIKNAVLGTDEKVEEEGMTTGK